MTSNDLPYEEYKGWFINQGITMPAQGIFEFNVYRSLARCAAEEDPDFVAENVGEARRWIDEEEEEHGLAIEFAESEAESVDQFLEESGRGPLWEQVKHGSYITFTNPSTGATSQYYNAFPSDSPEAVSAALMLKPYLQKRWGVENVTFEITSIPEEES